jgi:hypothetical protein
MLLFRNIAKKTAHWDKSPLLLVVWFLDSSADSGTS